MVFATTTRMLIKTVIVDSTTQMSWWSTAVWAIECAAAVGIVLRTRNDPVLAIATFAFLSTSMVSALLSDNALRQASSTMQLSMFMVLPRAYDAPDERIVIEYNASVGPVAVNFENGTRWGFLSARMPRQRVELAKWEVFLQDYMRGGSIAARSGRFFADSVYITLSSDRVLLNDMLVGEGFLASDATN